MLDLKKIAVTGSLASGKSTVCQIFQQLGAYVISADEIVHQLLSPTNKIGQQIIRAFGSDLLTQGQINRKKIADIVFSNPNQLRTLEAILHPAVFAEVEEKYQAAKAQHRYPLFVAEVPLLFEARAESQFDAVISVHCPKELAVERFTQNKQHTLEEFDLRMAQQLDPLEKLKKADYTIENKSTISELEQQVTTIYSILTST